MITVYHCEHCDEEFESSLDCEEHEMRCGFSGEEKCYNCRFYSKRIVRTVTKRGSDLKGNIEECAKSMDLALYLDDASECIEYELVKDSNIY